MQTETTPVSGDSRIDALTQAVHWAGASGSTLALSYSFAGPASVWDSGSSGYAASDLWGPMAGVSALANEQKVAAGAALQAWAAVANVRLTEVVDATATPGTIRLAFTHAPVAEQSYTYAASNTDKGGDIWLNADAAWDGFVPGSYGYSTLLHETGHALGLKHPFEGGVVLPSAQESYATTLMSYTAFAGAPRSWVDFEPTTPMPGDILAMQWLYGANRSHHALDDTYTFHPGQRYFETLWDAGGSDTIVWSGSSGVTIDLNPGAFSTLGQALTYWSEDFSRTWSDARTVAIAWGTQIEHAVGGSGNDQLVGNALDNRLVGGLGDDTLNGAAGTHDIADYRGASAVNVNLALGTATRGSERDTLIAIEAIFGSTASDTLRGLEGAANLPGEVFRGGGGNDTLHGGSGIDLAEFSGNVAAYSVQRTPGTMDVSVTHRSGGVDGSDSLSNVELLLFGDRLIGFGPRVEEVARVAFALWSPAIYASATLFSKGLSFYTNEYGYSLDTLCQVALQYWPETGTALAAKLVANAPGTAQTAASLLAVMNANGGGDALAGRAAAVKAVALDAATTNQLELMGVTTQGVFATLGFPSEPPEVFFGFLPG